MVIPTRPDPSELSTHHTVDPKTPKPDSPIPTELARQNIPNPPPQKKLQESNLEVKTKPEPNDVKTVTIAAEVFGFESVPTPEGEENMDLFLSLMDEDSTTEETSLTETETPQAESSDNEDLFMSLMGEEEHKVEAEPEVVTRTPAESTVSRHELDLLDVFSKCRNITDVELEGFTQQFLSDPSKESKITCDKGDIKQSAFIHIKEANTIFTRHKPSKEHFHAFHEFIKTLDLEPHEIQQLKLVHLNDTQWERTTVVIESFLSLQTNRSTVNQKQSFVKKSEETTTQQNLTRAKMRREPAPTNQEKGSKSTKAGYDEILELQREWNQEEILREERTKERDKKAREKEHLIIDKEISKTELKEELIKKDRKKP